MNTIDIEKTVAELVGENPARARAFERWGIGYCCEGKRPLAQVVKAKGLDEQAVLADLAECDAPRATTDWADASLSQMCDAVESGFHPTLKEALARLSPLTARVADRHGERDSRLVELRDRYSEFREELEAQVRREELSLLPWCRALGEKDKAGSCRGTNPIGTLMLEQESALKGLTEMGRLTNGFLATPDHCNTHRAMLHALGELDQNVREHTERLRKFLFPEAIRLEEELLTPL
jgi:regulator of cell morphogenesis and NO signaling